MRVPPVQVALSSNPLERLLSVWAMAACIPKAAAFAADPRQVPHPFRSFMLDRRSPDLAVEAAGDRFLLVKL